MKNKAKYLFQSSFLFFCLILLISGCNLKEKRDQKLATEIAVISTEIQSTMQAAQTQTIASIPTDTPSDLQPDPA
jgi:hypothetical protein